MWSEAAGASARSSVSGDAGALMENGLRSSLRSAPVTGSSERELSAQVPDGVLALTVKSVTGPRFVSKFAGSRSEPSEPTLMTESGCIPGISSHTLNSAAADEDLGL